MREIFEENLMVPAFLRVTSKKNKQFKEILLKHLLQSTF